MKVSEFLQTHSLEDGDIFITRREVRDRKEVAMWVVVECTLKKPSDLGTSTILVRLGHTAMQQFFSTLKGFSVDVEFDNSGLPIEVEKLGNARDSIIPKIHKALKEM